jgi:hypothetical protein
LVQDPAVPKYLPQPWYALHKVYAGLIDAYALGGNAQALAVVKRFAAWTKTFTDRLDDAGMQAVLDQEHGGMNEALANLAAITGDPVHLALARRFCHQAVLNPLANNDDVLDGLHANTQVPKFVGFARLYELTGEARYRDAAEHFWRVVTGERSYANGGNSALEKFTPKARLSLSLVLHNTETCNTYNLLKLTRHIFAWAPNAANADFSERAQLNHILSSQNPETGTVSYFHSMQSGNRKSFSPKWVSFACCHASGLENHAKHGESIYYHDGADRLFVNLFIASELNWKDAGLTVRQTTGFPAEEGTRLIIAAGKPVRTTISLRRPAWVSPVFGVTVNGQPVTVVPGKEGYIDLARTWKDGDIVVVNLPMALRWEGFKDDPDRAALFYGPTLLVAETSEGNRLAQTRKPGAAALAALTPTGTPLHFTGNPAVFTTGGLVGPIAFVPMYQEVRNPYIAYWDLRDDARTTADQAAYAAEARRWTELAPRTVDLAFFDMGTPSAATTLPGRLANDPALPRTAGAERTEKDHGLEAATGYNHEFNIPARQVAGYWQTFRTAQVGGDRFAWTLELAPERPLSVLVRVYDPAASDPEAKRATAGTLEVRAFPAEVVEKNGEKDEDGTAGNQLIVDKAKPSHNGTLLGIIPPATANGTFRDLSFPLPPSLIAGKKRLTVSFHRPKDKIAALVAEVRIVRN